MFGAECLVPSKTSRLAIFRLAGDAGGDGATFLAENWQIVVTMASINVVRTSSRGTVGTLLERRQWTTTTKTMLSEKGAFARSSIREIWPPALFPPRSPEVSVNAGRMLLERAESWWSKEQIKIRQPSYSFRSCRREYKT